MRPEIQALGALAVLLVVLYQLRPGVVRCGFVGADAFFAIWGLLITGSAGPASTLHRGRYCPSIRKRSAPARGRTI